MLTVPDDCLIPQMPFNSTQYDLLYKLFAHSKAPAELLVSRVLEKICVLAQGVFRTSGLLTCFVLHDTCQKSGVRLICILAAERLHWQSHCSLESFQTDLKVRAIQCDWEFSLLYSF